MPCTDHTWERIRIRQPYQPIRGTDRLPAKIDIASFLEERGRNGGSLLRHPAPDSFYNTFWEVNGPLVAFLSPRGHYKENRVTPANVYACLRNAVSHLDAAIILYENDKYAQSAALALLSLDETGKAVEQVFGLRSEGKPVTKTRLRHRERQLLATSPITVESGPSSRMGLVEKKFAEIYRAGLEEFRQKCLYVEIGPSGPVSVPNEVRPEDAFAVMCGAVEALYTNFGDLGEIGKEIVRLQKALARMNLGYLSGAET